MGKIEISGTNKATIDAAIRSIKAIVAVPEIGEIYEGKNFFYHALRCIR